MDEAQAIIERLGLTPLQPEGGWYRETYRGPLDSSGRSASTAIYYLLRAGERSRLHRLPKDEVWHFYAGDPVELFVLLPSGEGEVLLLGGDLAAGQRRQAMVPAQAWQGAVLRPGGRYALMGTTVAPGFEPMDFEAGDAEALAQLFPRWRDLLSTLARPGG